MPGPFDSSSFTTWGLPVDTVGDLPVDGIDGEARVVLAGPTIYLWNDVTGMWEAGTPGSDELVKISSNDLTGGFLLDKIVTGTSAVSLTEINDAGNEDLQIDVLNLVGDSGAGGTAGLVPPPAAGDAVANKFLGADGTWKVGGAGGTTNTVVGSNGITNVGNNTDADLAPTYGSAANTITEGNDPRLSDARTPTAHAGTHTDGTDDIQDATAAQKGLATATQITKLDGIEALADVTDATNVAAAGAVMETLADAKGDLFAATANDVVGRLPIGADGQILTADSLESTGMKWAASGGSGETNTASNVNTAGVGVFKQKTGVDFEFRGVKAASAKATVVLDAPTNEIRVDVADASATQAGAIEIADQAEVDTGTDTTRAIVPATLAGSTLASDVTTNNAKVTNATHTGDVTGATVLTIAADAVTNAKLANMAEALLKGRASGAGTGDPTDLTATQVRTILNVEDGATKGVVADDEGSPLSAGASFTKIDAVGAGITASDGGGGTLMLTVSGGTAPVDSVFGRTGVVVAADGDYDASLVSYTPAVLTDWDSDTDPGDVDAALDQLAERVDDNETNISSNITGPGSSVDLGVPVFDGTGGDILADSGVRNYGKLANDPTGSGGPGDPAPASGDTYWNTVLDMKMYYDDTRAKWLSFDTDHLWFGRSGNTGAGAYYRGPDRRAYSATIGRHAEHNGTIVSITYSRNDIDSATFEVTADGTAISVLASSALKGKDITLNNNFAADQILGARNETGGNTTTRVAGWIRWRWRA